MSEMTLVHFVPQEEPGTWEFFLVTHPYKKIDEFPKLFYKAREIAMSVSDSWGLDDVLDILKDDAWCVIDVPFPIIEVTY